MKKKILIYVGLIALDVVGAYSIFFFNVTHIFLLIYIFGDLYFFTIHRLEKSGRPVSKFLNIILIIIFAILCLATFNLSYSLYWHLLAPHGI